MKKKIAFGMFAVFLVTSAIVFAENIRNKYNNTCPDRPGCICSKSKTEQIETVVKATAEKEICPNKPGCICK